MEDQPVREVGIREARAILGDLVHEAAVNGHIAYLTNRGRRVAAVVPLAIAEQAERDRESK
jgi:prevent-host-death family protein